jgi:lipoate-protein ligase A
MALDEALLDTVSAGEATAYLRTYGWTVPTLSLGYFQRHAQYRDDPRWQSVAVVRRLTGGGAIWHHHEVTYALVVPAGFPQARPNTALYWAVHAAIAETLASAGLLAHRRGDAAPHVTTGDERPFLCFADRDSEDLIVQGFKVDGSAQRRSRGAILQHGSLLLAWSPRVPELPGLRELAGAPAGPEFWSGRLVGPIVAALGLNTEAATVSDELRARASTLATNTYQALGWTQAR